MRVVRNMLSPVLSNFSVPSLAIHWKREDNEGIYPQIRNFKQIWKTKWDRSVLMGEMELKLQFSEIAV